MRGSTSTSEVVAPEEPCQDDVKQQLQSYLGPHPDDPNPNGPKPMDSPSVPKSTADPFPVVFSPNNAVAPALQSIFASSGYWEGVVDGRRIIVYAGEVGSDAASDKAASGEGRIWVQELSDIDVTLDSRWISYPGTGLLRFDDVQDHTATVSPQTGDTLTVDLSELAATLNGTSHQYGPSVSPRRGRAPCSAAEERSPLGGASPRPCLELDLAFELVGFRLEAREPPALRRPLVLGPR